MDIEQIKWWSEIKLHSRGCLCGRCVTDDISRTYLLAIISDLASELLETLYNNKEQP